MIYVLALHRNWIKYKTSVTALGYSNQGKVTSNSSATTNTFHETLDVVNH